ncbi:MAG: rhamnogalacturonan acetylesterase [Anaerolineae bacterium]|nr:rhamnogalacturonan acetylesterase [Anaerolineae bacterium]
MPDLDKPSKIFLAGDSTMAAKLPEKRPESGWGEFLQDQFMAGTMRVENHAKNGQSTRTFITERLWQAILDRLDPGDYVFIQFGHNDQPKEKQDRHTTPDEYRQNLVRFVHEARERHALPVLLTPVMRRQFDEQGGLCDTHGEYPDIVRGIADENSVPLIDMHRSSQSVIQQYGVEGSKRLFLWLQPKENINYPAGLEDNTHFSPLGAQLMASLAVQGIRALQLDLANYLKPSD